MIRPCPERIPVSHFKANAGDLAEEIHDSGATIVVGQHGAALAALRPAMARPGPRSLALGEVGARLRVDTTLRRPRGGMAGSVIFNVSDDELVHFDTTAEWDQAD